MFVKRKLSRFRTRWFSVGILAVVAVGLFLVGLQTVLNHCSCPNTRNVPLVNQDGHRLCILVPFRDRLEELSLFLPHISSFLLQQGVVDPDIYVLNQVDEYRFNRALLLNAGFLESQKNNDRCDYVALHDVDLVPINPKIEYKFPMLGPLHLTAPGLHPKYDYSTFIGGILLVSVDHFLQLNGLSNRYWGWGMEDDEFYARVKEAKLPIERPDVDAESKDVFLHYHSSVMRKRDMVKCHNQWEETRLRDRETGLNSASYSVKQRLEGSIEGFPFTLLNLILHCDKSKTPWCDCSGAKPEIQPWKKKGLKPGDVIVPVMDKPKGPRKRDK